MVRLATLGECAIEVGEARVGPEAEMVFAALLVLAFEAGRRVPRQELIQLLWPSVDDKRARHSLRQTLYRIRQLGAPLEASELEVCLPTSAVRADFTELESGLPDAGLGALASVGDFLPGYAPALSAAFTKRLERYRDSALAHVRRLLIAALEECRRSARWSDTESLARRCLQLDPLNEAATLALAEATAMTGNKARALEIIDRYTAEAGGGDGRVRDLVRVQPAILRRRITERVPEHRYGAAAEAEFIGRDDSIAFLSALFEDARAGHGRGCLVWGDAGIGKTRLVTEFTDAAALRGARVQRVGCQPSDVHRPLSVFVDVVPSLLNVPGALGCSPESMSYLKRLTEHDRSSTTPSEASREAEFLHGRVRRALLDLIDAIASEGTLVLVVEDVHWLDPMSWSVLRETIEWGATRRLMIIMTSRTSKLEDEPPRWAGRPLERHHLEPLAEQETARLVASLLRGVEHAELDGKVLARWTDLADGNPLFARELVQQWMATGEECRPPDSLLALIDARVSSLSSAALRVVQVCAVLGKNASVQRVAAVLQYHRHRMLTALDELDTGGLLISSPTVVRVRHELIADAALRRLSAVSRALLHGSAARVLEEEVVDSTSAAQLWDCARHWQLAGSTIDVLRLATARSAHLLELGLPLQAAGICADATEYCTSDFEREALLRQQCFALQVAGEWPELINQLDQLSRMQPGTDGGTRHDDNEIVEYYARYRAGGDVTVALKRAMECAREPTASAPHRLEGASIALTLAYHCADKTAFQEVYRIVEPILEHGAVAPKIRARVQVRYYTLSGRLGDAVRAARELIDMERRDGNEVRLAQALSQAWNAFFAAGLLAEAEQAVLEAYEIRRRCQGPLETALSCAVLTCHYSLLNESSAAMTAERWYVEAEKWRQLGADCFFTQSIAIEGSRLALRRGDIAESKRRLRVSIDEFLSDTAVQRRVQGIATWLGTELSEGRIPALDIVLRLRDDVTRTFWTGPCDFEVQTLLKALIALGMREDAISLRDDYLRRYRMGNSPIAAELLSPIHED